MNQDKAGHGLKKNEEASDATRVFARGLICKNAPVTLHLKQSGLNQEMKTPPMQPECLLEVLSAKAHQ